MINDQTIIINSPVYWFTKRCFDLILSIIILPVFFLIMIILFVLNRYLNPGPIFYVQNRMGKNCTMFRAIKFRSMSVARTIERKFDDPVEDNRITPLGRVLRNSRLDEIPQIINVLKGEMSLIGPRPDYYEHAVIFLKDVKGYELRHIIRPGISGLSQIRLGYAVGIKDTKSKVMVDLFYIRNAGFILDAKIIFGTFLTILNRTGN